MQEVQGFELKKKQQQRVKILDNGNTLQKTVTCYYKKTNQGMHWPMLCVKNNKNS